MNEYKYNPLKMTPFKWFVLENFPFIEEDFDSLTSYGLWCKLKEYFDKVATKTNEMGTQVENITNAFIALKNYIDDYFANLDVQDEINHKLDEMVNNGTLTLIIANYVNPTIEQQNLTIDNFKNQTNNKLNNMQTQINSVASGSPLVASSINDMTQTNRVYVNTTNGHWYYYNGENWVDGGVYQGTSVSNVDPEIVKLNNYHDDTINLFKTTANGLIENTFDDCDYGFINQDDGISGVGYQNSKHTDYIPFIPVVGTVISCVARAIQNSVRVISLYDKNKNYITSVSGRYPNAYTADTYTLNITNEHSNARYVRFSSYIIVSTPTPTLKYSITYNYIPKQIEKKINEKIYDFSLLDSFLKIGVIGDSLSVGWMAKPDGTYSDRNLKYSWPQYFARKYGIDMINMGQSGVTAKGWLTNNNCYPVAQLQQNKSQCYIIGLGVNDNVNTYNDGWGTLNDIKEDYHNNSDSFYGCYGGIVQRIKEINEDCVIFCLSIPGARQNDNKNNYIRQIANYFGTSNNVHFIDLTEYNDIYNDERIQQLYVQGHYVSVGYNICSQIINRAISNYILENSQYFKYTGFIPYAE